MLFQRVILENSQQSLSTLLYFYISIATIGCDSPVNDWLCWLYDPFHLLNWDGKIFFASEDSGLLVNRRIRDHSWRMLDKNFRTLGPLCPLFSHCIIKPMQPPLLTISAFGPSIPVLTERAHADVLYGWSARGNLSSTGKQCGFGKGKSRFSFHFHPILDYTP